MSDQDPSPCSPMWPRANRGPAVLLLLKGPASHLRRHPHHLLAFQRPTSKCHHSGASAGASQDLPPPHRDTDNGRAGRGPTGTIRGARNPTVATKEGPLGLSLEVGTRIHRRDAPQEPEAQACFTVPLVASLRVTAYKLPGHWPSPRTGAGVSTALGLSPPSSSVGVGAARPHLFPRLESGTVGAVTPGSGCLAEATRQASQAQKAALQHTPAASPPHLTVHPFPPIVYFLAPLLHSCGQPASTHQ